jgi:EmrB/QacA subfamily drug resistance transporter
MTAHRNPWLVLVLVCMAQFMVVLDATIVNVALPSIQKDLHMSEADLQWIVNAYALLFGGFLLLGGRAGDLMGRKRIFLVGVVVFTVASLLNGFSPSSELLIVFRGLQGLGAAMIAPAALSIITTTFEEGAERTKAMGVWAAIAVGGGAVGLVLGGVLVEWLSWPWIFFVNVPVGIAVFAASMRFVPESKDEHVHQGFDLAGAVTVTSGLVALVYGIVKAQEKGWGSTHTIGFGLLAAALLTAFVLIERRSTEPLVRLSIFRVRTIRAANVVMLFVASGIFAMFFFNTLYIQRVLGFSPIQAGLAFLPFTAGIIIGAGLAQRLVPKLGAREVPLIGMAMAVAGLLLFLRLQPDGSYLVDLLPAMILVSIGMGLTFVPVTLIATSGIPVDDAGLASGLFNTSQQVGGALGLAILSTLAATATSNTLSSVSGRPTSAEQAQALVDGFHVAFLGSAIVVAAGAMLLLLLLRRRDVVAVGEGAVEPGAEPAAA